MRASKCTFNDMMIAAIGNLQLGTSTSFIQVEFGLAELETCWSGFVDSSDHFGLDFTSKKHVFNEFASALSDYIEFLGEPTSIKVGS
jgi:hypothetical protein